MLGREAELKHRTGLATLNLRSVLCKSLMLAWQMAPEEPDSPTMGVRVFTVDCLATVS